MDKEYDIVEYKGFLICRWSDLWEIRKDTTVIGTEWTQEDAIAFVDRIIQEGYYSRH